jgi:hypothetical protein
VALEAFDRGAVRWVVDTGLAPLFVHAIAQRPDTARFPLWPMVRAADLTARVITADQMDAMTEIIDACRDEAPPLVLLKGVSIADQYYPAPHLRPMRDIDVLVEDEAVPGIEAVLAKLGYVQPPQRSAAFYETHHHGAPFVHHTTGVWVDVHRRLVPPTSALRWDTAFSLETLRRELRPSTFRDRPVRRLSDELQIVYLSCHWAQRLQLVGGMVTMTDLTYLSRNAPGIQWSRILEWARHSVACRSLELLLTYVTRRRLIDVDTDVLQRLSSTQSRLDRFTRDLGHALVDRYVVAGRELGGLVSERTLGRLWRTLVLRRRPARRHPAPADAPTGA